MGMPKRFAVFEVGFFRASGQTKQILSKAYTSLKRAKFLVPAQSCLIPQLLVSKESLTLLVFAIF